MKAQLLVTRETFAFSSLAVLVRLDLRQSALESQGFFPDARAARVLREVHPVEGVPPCKSRTKRVGTVPVRESGLVMKPRGMIHRLLPDFLRVRTFCFFLRQALFFSFYLTDVGVFCNHFRPPAD